MQRLYYLFLFVRVPLASFLSWQQLFESCFDEENLQKNGPPRDAELTLTALDDFRHVQLTFLVNGKSDGKECEIRWRETDPRFPLGKIVSTYRDSGQPLPRNDDYYASRDISIYIYDDFPRWELHRFYTDGLISGKLLRSFIVQGMTEHGHRVDNPSIQLELHDHSVARELYWLQKHTGKTYYQDVWNLEYTCLSCLDDETLTRLREVSKTAHDAPADIAFRDTTFEPILPKEEGNEDFEFFGQFIQELLKYTASKDSELLRSMTIGNVLDEFIPQWQSSDKYGKAMQQALAQNTFMYFFRAHPDWSLLAMQVLSGYDYLCKSMQGIPRDLMPHDMSLKYFPKYASEVERITFGESSSQSPKQAVANASGVNSFVITNFITGFLALSFLLISLLTSNMYCFQQPENSEYSEI